MLIENPVLTAISDTFVTLKYHYYADAVDHQ